MMTADQNNVLSLISATIFADNHVYDCEVEAFISVTSKLKLFQQAKPKISKACLLAWFEQNKEDVRQRITNPYFKDWLYTLLKKLSDNPEKASLLDAMKKVSIADGAIHISERTLFSLAQAYWGVS